MKLKSLQDLAQLLPEGREEHPVAGALLTHDGKGMRVRLSIERKGRKGKTVTILAGVGHDPETLSELAKLLKERCGTGGTVKEGIIELQGDQRDRAAKTLRAMNYSVK